MSKEKIPRECVSPEFLHNFQLIDTVDNDYEWMSSAAGQSPTRRVYIFHCAECGEVKREFISLI